MNDDPGPREDWESEMSREFDRRVRDLNEAPFSIQHVKDKASVIQLTRRVAVTGGILAAAAVIIPVAVFAGQGLGGPDSMPSVPAATSSDEVASPDASDILATKDVHVDYLQGATWVRPDGSIVPLDTAYMGGTVLGATLLGVRNDDDTGMHYLDVVDRTGEVTESIEFVSGLAVNDDHTTVAYLEPDGDLMTLWDPSAGTEGRVSLAAGLLPDVSPVAILEGPNCYEAKDGCTVFFNHGDGETPPESVSSHGTTDQLAFTEPAPIKITDAAPNGMRTMQQSYTDAGSCNGIYDQRSSSYVLETCKNYLLGLNPAGDLVAATHALLDGIGVGYVAILNADGEEVGRIDPGSGGFVHTNVMWEDNDSLLATVFEDGEWSLWRLNADGSKERVAGPSAEGAELTPAYTLLGGY